MNIPLQGIQSWKVSDDREAITSLGDLFWWLLFPTISICHVPIVTLSGSSLQSLILVMAFSTILHTAYTLHDTS